MCWSRPLSKLGSSKLDLSPSTSKQFVLHHFQLFPDRVVSSSAWQSPCNPTPQVQIHSLWCDPAGGRTHDLPFSGQTRLIQSGKCPHLLNSSSQPDKAGFLLQNDLIWVVLSDFPCNGKPQRCSVTHPPPLPLISTATDCGC